MNRIPLWPILTPIILLVLCLGVLPNTCSSTVTVALPDDRSWLSKLAGDSAPTTTEEVTNWLVVIIVTVAVCFVGFVISCMIEYGRDHGIEIRISGGPVVVHLKACLGEVVNQFDRRVSGLKRHRWGNDRRNHSA